MHGMSAFKSLPRLLGFALLTAACAATTSPESSTAQVSDVSGTWIGSYRSQDGNAGACTLILKQDQASVGGTIQATNVDRSFGAAPQMLRDGRLVGSKLLFSATGQDGGVFRADFNVKGGQAIEGWGRHTGPGYDADVRFTLTRQ